MADQEMLDAIAIGELMIQVNGNRSFCDPFRLNQTLDDLITQRTGAAKVANSVTLRAADVEALQAMRHRAGMSYTGKINHAHYLKGEPAR
jgi:hypothetical protein